MSWGRFCSSIGGSRTRFCIIKEWINTAVLRWYCDQESCDRLVANLIQRERTKIMNHAPHHGVSAVYSLSFFKFMRKSSFLTIQYYSTRHMCSGALYSTSPGVFFVALQIKKMLRNAQERNVRGAISAQPFSCFTFFCQWTGCESHPMEEKFPL